MPFLDKLNWKSIEKFLDIKKYSAETKEMVQNIFNEKADEKDNTVTFSDLVEMLTKAKKTDKKARDIVYSDLKSLPAGYIVIFIPEDNETFGNYEGHICITNGYGQGYSDSTDNLEWVNYYSSYGGTGKGEHGRFVVYKLNESNWVTTPDGKLKFEK